MTPSEHPILFSGPMVKAILEGRKTQTRRVVKPQPVLERDLLEPCNPKAFLFAIKTDVGTTQMLGKQNFVKAQSRFQPGGRFWVRETWGPCEGGFCYRASERPEAKPDDGRWHPAIHMFRTASRITLQIESVCVERVQDISEEDAKAEGAGKQAPLKAFKLSELCRASFRELWDSINKSRGFGWDTNCWVWKIAFRKI